MKLPVKYSKLSPKERRETRLLYIEKQRNKCYFCKSSLNGSPPDTVTKFKVNESLYPNGFFDNPIHLHHNHNNDLTIGAVHAYCNAILWQYYGE